MLVEEKAFEQQCVEENDLVMVGLRIEGEFAEKEEKRLLRERRRSR